MVNDKPTSTPSTKSETENPEYSMCTNHPIRMPSAMDIIPIDNIVSALSLILFTVLNKPIVTV